MKTILSFILLSLSINSFSAEYGDYKKAKDALNGRHNISIEEVEGHWERIITEVVSFCNVSDPKDYGRSSILRSGDNHLISIEITDQGSVVVEDTPSMRYLNGKKERASIEKGVMFYGYSALSGFVGEDGHQYIVVGFESDIGKECPMFSIYQRL